MATATVDVEPGTNLKQRVDLVLGEFVETETGHLLAIDEDLRPVADQLRIATAHGKRLRAAFCYWGWRATGQPDSAALVRAAAAMELVHAAAVVHDDLIDNSRLRHGLPTAHLALRDAMAGRPRPDGAARSLAMLTGDLLMSWAGQLFTDSGLPAAYLARARLLWPVLARELVAGECLEILRTGARPDVDASLEVIRYKTAKYTVEHPLHIGGVLGGASAELRECFTAYALPLGEAFQLRDDLLGVFGDPDRTGKANTDDIAAARPTVLVALAWHAATGAERRDLRRLLGSRRAEAEGLERVRTIMRRTGAPARVERMVADRVGTAVDVVRRAPLPGGTAEALVELAHTATVRQS
ncbi:polyprenyl synthetase family protein [Glycomyces sp. YM15]|uniref:polyprenyl synthetase family protein n=1 Tax=Glycomyces sp. YM15 TaxID=2800446 RepID=UPI001966A7C8|nr:polyprenyl synthetase family protein [Glycomyces sp. YM15]